MYYSNQEELKNGMFKSSFLFAHDDHFGREFQTKEEILDYILGDSCYIDKNPIRNMGLGFEVHVVSENEYGINCFQLDMFYSEPIEDILTDGGSFDSIYRLYSISNLENVKYYECIRCKII